MSLSADRIVRHESIAAVYRQLPLTLGVSLVNALVTALVLAPRTGWDRLSLWLGAMVLMAAPRAIAWRWFRRSPEARGAATVSVVGSVVSGLLWGMCGALLTPADGPYPLFVAFVIGGMCAGAATVNATHLPSVIGFMLPAVLPLALWFLAQGSRLSAAMAAMTALFAAALVLAAARSGAVFAASVRARLDLAERTEQLAEANAKLRTEMAERQQAEAALRQAQKLEAIGSLTAGVAHDFNNLLMVISGSAEVLGRPGGGAAQLAAIQRATARGAALTRQLLAFARREALNPESVDLNAVLRGTAVLLGATLGKSVEIVLNLADDLPPVLVDRNEIERALVNLAINARDAMEGGGTLTFRTAALTGAIDDLPEGAYVVASIADTGSGMTEAVRARAFDPFFTTKPTGRGSGLGLSQVYGLLRQSGGTTRIESAPGAGTTISLYLPQAETTALPPPQPEPPPTPAGDMTTAHIALLDDEDMVRDVVADMLQSAGYRVSAFAEPEAAMAAVAADGSVALLLTDLGLPGRSGAEVARLVRQGRPALPVVFITGYNDPGALSGEAWQLRKPFGEAMLLATVEQALAARPAVA